MVRTVKWLISKLYCIFPLSDNDFFILKFTRIKIYFLCFVKKHDHMLKRSILILISLATWKSLYPGRVMFTIVSVFFHCTYFISWLSKNGTCPDNFGAADFIGPARVNIRIHYVPSLHILTISCFYQLVFLWIFTIMIAMPPSHPLHGKWEGTIKL